MRIKPKNFICNECLREQYTNKICYNCQSTDFSPKNYDIGSLYPEKMILSSMYGKLKESNVSKIQFLEHSLENLKENRITFHHENNDPMVHYVSGQIDLLDCLIPLLKDS